MLKISEPRTCLSPICGTGKAETRRTPDIVTREGATIKKIEPQRHRERKEITEKRCELCVYVVQKKFTGGRGELEPAFVDREPSFVEIAFQTFTFRYL